MAAVMLMVPVAIAAQPTEPREPVSSGAIIMPPQTDPKAVKPVPEKVDPEIAVPPTGKKPLQKLPQEKIPPKRQSKDDDCKGRKELCNQSSPR